jgi:hypothetical protein
MCTIHVYIEVVNFKLLHYAPCTFIRRPTINSNIGGKESERKFNIPLHVLATVCQNQGEHVKYRIKIT